VTLVSCAVTRPATATAIGAGFAHQDFVLFQNRPNPYNPVLNLGFTVPFNGKATLILMNTFGQEVATVFDGMAATGKYHRAQINTSGFPAGLYFTKLDFDGKTRLKKMTLVK
jgi:hypothetical protein